MSKFAIVAVARDENAYLAEWVKHHIDIGFDEILLYDNHSAIPLQTEIDKMAPLHRKRVKVEIEPISPNPQFMAYNRGLERLKGNADWIAYLDIDEFLNIEKPLPELLDHHDGSCGAVLVCWQFFSANGHVRYEDKPVVERFTAPCENHDWCVGKAIARPYATLAAGVHYPVLHNIYHMTTMSGVVCHHAAVKPPIYEGMWIAHYYTKSHEEWLWKLNRGSCDSRCLKKYNEFFFYNPDMLHLHDPAFADIQQSTRHERATHMITKEAVTLSQHAEGLFKLHLGCGPDNRLNGWTNTDAHPMSEDVIKLDFTLPFAFPDNVCDAIFCEHSIEHVDVDDVERMFAEVYRVLKPGGVLRVVTPSLDKICRMMMEPSSVDAEAYVAFHRIYTDYDTRWPGRAGAETSIADAINYMFFGHGHKHVYGEAELTAMLEEAGFTNIRKLQAGYYGHKIFDGVDGHAKAIASWIMDVRLAEEINRIESVAFEAEKAGAGEALCHAKQNCAA
jgi:Glycosyl transferase family 2/Methyltransferase domain